MGRDFGQRRQTAKGILLRIERSRGENDCVLTVYTDYALRLLMYLALKDDGLATIAKVAEAHDLQRITL